MLLRKKDNIIFVPVFPKTHQNYKMTNHFLIKKKKKTGV